MGDSFDISKWMDSTTKRETGKIQNDFLKTQVRREQVNTFLDVVERLATNDDYKVNLLPGNTLDELVDGYSKIINAVSK